MPAALVAKHAHKSIALCASRKPSFAGYLRAAALMANGVTPVEQNPDFVAQLTDAGPRVILACEAGGVLDPSSSFPFGKESRSLKVLLHHQKPWT